jgi:hypothetical protein
MLIEEFLKKNYKFIVGAILTLFFIVSAINANNDSPTFDEIAHIPAGYSYVKENQIRLNPEHPPLLKDMAGIPLLFLNLNFDTTQDFWTGNLPTLWDAGQWAAGRHLLYEAGNNADQIVFWARIPIVILATFFGFFLFKWGKELTGVIGGLFVLTLYAFDPNILGHNHYVTTDLGIAAFLTFSFYYFLKFIKDPSWKNALIGGFFMGLVHLVKFSSVLMFPIFGLILIIYPLVKKISHSDNIDKQKGLRLKIFLDYLLKGAAAFVFSMIIVWGVYTINDYKIPKEVVSKTIEFYFPAADTNVKTVYTNKVLIALNENTITRPMSEYVMGVAMVFKRVAGGNGAYFMQKVSSVAFVDYFPTVFLIKETLPFLILILFSLAYTLWQTTRSATLAIKAKKAKEKLRAFMQTSVVSYTLFAFIILYAYLSITGNLNIGFRHLFPILPFAYLLVTKKVFDFFGSRDQKTAIQMKILASFLLIWLIFEAVIAYPGYVSYFNEIVGGSKNGYKYVTDSNTDWGQDLKRLKIFLDKNPQIEKIHVDYFGGGNPKQLLGDKYLQWWDSMRPVEPGWYAISANFLQGSIYDTKNKTIEDNYAWTLKYKPVTMIENSILIFYVPEQK